MLLVMAPLSVAFTAAALAAEGARRLSHMGPVLVVCIWAHAACCALQMGRSAFQTALLHLKPLPKPTCVEQRMPSAAS